MKILTLAAAVSVIICALTGQGFATTKDYCDSFARDAASRKTGVAEDSTASPDSRWTDAYQASLSGCMARYGAPQVAQTDGSAKAQPRAEQPRKQRVRSARAMKKLKRPIVARAKARPKKAPAAETVEPVSEPASQPRITVRSGKAPDDVQPSTQKCKNLACWLRSKD